MSAEEGLGIPANYVTPPPESETQRTEFVAESRKRRYSLQRIAADLVPDQRVSGCLRHLKKGGDGVSVYYVPATNSAHYDGLQTCGSVWVCPVCAAKISVRRREELKTAIEKADAQGLSVIMATFTLQHTSEDKLEELVEALNDSYRRLKRGEPWKNFCENYHVVGYITALETPFGKVNGWHPHKHAILFLSGPVDDAQISKIEDWLSKRFRTMLAKNERYGSPKYSVDVRTKKDAVAYVTKWGLESEITGGEEKTGHGYTPFKLLELYSMGERWAAQRFIEYAGAMKGKRQLVWSKGLRELLGLDVEMTDEEIAEKREEDAVRLVTLDFKQWCHVLSNEWQGARAELLNVASCGDADKVMEYLVSIGVKRSILPDGWKSTG